MLRLRTANARALGRPQHVERPPFARTGRGNVSHAPPSIRPAPDISGGTCGPHEAAFAEAAVSPAAERAPPDGATAMAWTAAGLAGARRDGQRPA